MFIAVSKDRKKLPSFAQQTSAEISVLASQYVQGKLTAAQVEKQIKNQLPTAIPIFIETIQVSAEPFARQQELLLDLSKAVRSRSTEREVWGMATAMAAFTLLEAAVILSGHNEMANDSFFLRHPELVNQWLELQAIAFAPALSAISIPFGLIPLRGQTARNNAVSALANCSLWLGNEALLSEAP